LLTLGQSRTRSDRWTRKASTALRISLARRAKAAGLAAEIWPTASRPAQLLTLGQSRTRSDRWTRKASTALRISLARRAKAAGLAAETWPTASRPAHLRLAAPDAPHALASLFARAAAQRSSALRRRAGVRLIWPEWLKKKEETAIPARPRTPGRRGCLGYSALPQHIFGFSVLYCDSTGKAQVQVFCIQVSVKAWK
jgi:hypothetical protein